MSQELKGTLEKVGGAAHLDLNGGGGRWGQRRSPRLLQQLLLTVQPMRLGRVGAGAETGRRACARGVGCREPISWHLTAGRGDRTGQVGGLQGRSRYRLSTRSCAQRLAAPPSHQLSTGTLPPAALWPAPSCWTFSNNRSWASTSCGRRPGPPRSRPRPAPSQTSRPQLVRCIMIAYCKSWVGVGVTGIPSHPHVQRARPAAGGQILVC